MLQLKLKTLTDASAADSFTCVPSWCDIQLAAPCRSGTAIGSQGRGKPSNCQDDGRRALSSLRGDQYLPRNAIAIAEPCAERSLTPGVKEDARLFCGNSQWQLKEPPTD